MRGDQLGRVLSVLQRLETSAAGVTVATLAKEAGVTPRTLHRDLRALEKAALPLRRELRNGEARWSAEPSGRRHDAPLTASESVALACAHAVLWPLAGTPLGDALESLVRKVRAGLSPEARRLFSAADGAWAAGLPGRDRYVAKRELLSTVTDAAFEHRTIDLVYDTPRRGPSRRLFDPYRLWLLDGALYLVGHDHRRERVVTLRFDRVQSASRTEATFARPDGFSLADYLGDAYRVFRGEAEDVQVWFDADVAHVVRERPLHPSQRLSARPDGSATVTLRVGGLPELLSKVLSFGRHARVLAPASLVERAAAETEGAAARYRVELPARIGPRRSARANRL